MQFLPLLKDVLLERVLCTCCFHFLNPCSLLNPWVSGFYLREPAKVHLLKLQVMLLPTGKSSRKFWFLTLLVFCALFAPWDYFLHGEPLCFFPKSDDSRSPYSSLTTLPLLCPSHQWEERSTVLVLWKQKRVQLCPLQGMHACKGTQWGGQHKRTCHSKYGLEDEWMKSMGWSSSGSIMTIRNIRGIGSFLIASGSQHSGHRALGKFPECHEHFMEIVILTL